MTTPGGWNKGKPAANAGKKFPVEILTGREVRLMLHHSRGPGFSSARNAALIVMFYRGGLRISEALALKESDLNEAANTVRVFGKGKKQRIIGLDPRAWEVIRRWLAVRFERCYTNGVPLFCTKREKPLAQAYVRNLLVRLAKKAGIQKRVHPHGLRHTLASELRREGVDIGIISKQLGHADIATTARYLDHVAPIDVIVTAITCQSKAPRQPNRSLDKVKKPRKKRKRRTDDD